MLAELCLANVGALLLNDLSNCPALILVGQPSSTKTTILDFLDTEFIYTTDNFTPRNFVSHAASVSRKTLGSEVDLLPRIKHKMVVVKDLSPLFGRREEDLQEAMGSIN